MTALLHAHSGLRYLVLLAALVSIGYLAMAVATGRPFGKPGRILPSIFVGLLDLQVLLGLVTLFVTGRFYPAIWGHVVMMIAAAAVTHVLLVRNRKNAAPNHTRPLVAVAVALALIVGGIGAIGRSPLQTTVVPTSVAQ